MTVRELISVLSNQDQGAEVVGYEELTVKIKCFPVTVIPSQQSELSRPYQEKSVEEYHVCASCGHKRTDISTDPSLAPFHGVCSGCFKETCHMLTRTTTFKKVNK